MARPEEKGIKLEGYGPMGGRLVPVKDVHGPYPDLIQPWFAATDVWGNQWAVLAAPYYWDRALDPNDDWQHATRGHNAQKEAFEIFFKFSKTVMLSNGWDAPDGDLNFVTWLQAEIDAGRSAPRSEDLIWMGAPWTGGVFFDLGAKVSTEWWHGWFRAYVNYWTRTAVLSDLAGLNYDRLRWDIARDTIKGIFDGATKGAVAGSVAGPYGAVAGAIIGGVTEGIDAGLNSWNPDELNRAFNEAINPTKNGNAGGGGGNAPPRLKPKQEAGIIAALGAAAFLVL